MPEEKKKKVSKKKILLLIIVCGIIAVSLFITFGVLFWTSTAKVRVAAQDFIAAAEAGNVSGAYDSTSVAFRSVTTAEDLGIFLAAFPIDAESMKFTYIAVEKNVATLSGTAIVGEEESPITFTLVKEDGFWKVVNFSLDPNDVPKN